MVYYDCFDSLHHFIFHLFDSGFRFLNNDENIEIDDYKDNDFDKINDIYYDKEFAKRIKTISNSRDATQRFDRISANSANKFCIKNDNDNYEHIEQEHIEYDMDTYLDSIFAHLYDENRDIRTIAKLRKFLLDEEFDTICVDLDLSSNDPKLSNISFIMDDKVFIDMIISRLNDTRSMFHLSMIQLCIVYKCFVNI